jgi:hypothetical protein
MRLFPCQEYLRLTDCVLKTIECSRDPALGKSQAIIRRLRKRQLYKLVDTILLPKAIDAKVRKVQNFDIESFFVHAKYLLICFWGACFRFVFFSSRS